MTSGTRLTPACQCMVALLLSFLLSLAPPAFATTPPAFATTPPSAENDFADWLLDAPFVVDGVLDANSYEERGGPALLPVRVTQVLLGSIAESTLTLNTLSKARWPRGALREGTHVIAWGVPRADGQCLGNVACITPQGGLLVGHRNIMGPPQAPFTLDGRSISEADSYQRLLRAFSSRASENSAEWLVGGRGIALVCADSVSRADVFVHLVAWICGEEAGAPRVLRLVPRRGPRLMPVVGDRLLVPTAPDQGDTLIVPIPLSERLRVNGNYVIGLGVSPGDLNRAVWQDGTRLRVRRIRASGNGE